MTQVIATAQPALPARVPPGKPHKSHKPLRYAAWGALGLGVLSYFVQGPGMANHEFHLPGGVDTVPGSPLRDGVFAGAVHEIPSGDVQVTATVENGRIQKLDVDWPRNERHSRVLNDHAVPELADRALRGQTGDIQFVTGATNTSRGFTRSLQDALNQAAVR